MSEGEEERRKDERIGCASFSLIQQGHRVDVLTVESSYSAQRILLNQLGVGS